MIVNFAKSLDRPVDIFGIKGKWLTIFLVGAGLGFVMALIVGFLTSAGVGIATAIVMLVLSFITCMLLQGKVSYRQVTKVKASSMMPSHMTRRETLGRILLPDPAQDDDFKEDTL